MNQDQLRRKPRARAIAISISAAQRAKNEALIKAVAVGAALAAAVEVALLARYALNSMH